MAYDKEIKEIANEVREKIGEPKYEWFGHKTTVGLTRNELIRLVESNYHEIILDMPDEFKEYQDALKKFMSEWEKKLGWNSQGLKHYDESDIWNGKEFIENTFAKKWNEEYEKEHPRPTFKRPKRTDESK